MHATRSPSLDLARDAAVRRAHQLRSAAMADLVRNVARWVSRAAR